MTTNQPNAARVAVRSITIAAIQSCPHLIMDARHYRPDNTCRCDDASHREMAEWGYKWRGGLWR